mgnify:FL=1
MAWPHEDFIGTGYQGEIRIRTDRLHRAFAAYGIQSVQALADRLGVHRNTVDNILHGRTILPRTLERILLLLDLDPGEILELRRTVRKLPGSGIAPLIDDLHDALPKAAIVIFGERTREEPGLGIPPERDPYTLGVFRTSKFAAGEVPRLRRIVTRWRHVYSARIRIVDLHEAPEDYVRGIAEELRFLAGPLGAWCALLEKAGLRPSE